MTFTLKPGLSQIGFSLAALGLFSIGAVQAAQTSDSNVLHGTTITASNYYDSTNLPGSALTDGAASPFAFADPSTTNPESISISGFTSSISTLRFFDAPAFTGRTSPSVIVGYSSTANAGLAGNYTFLNGDTPLTLATSNSGNDYANSTNPAEVMTGPGSNGSQVIFYSDLTGLAIPSGTKSLLLEFTAPPLEVVGGNTYNNGAALTEIQGFAGTAAPEPTPVVALGLFAMGIGAGIFKSRKRTLR